MNAFQKTVKYIALGFALFLSVTIISFMVNITLSVSDALTGSDTGPTKNITLDYDNVTSLKIDNSFGTVTITEGDSFQIVANDVSNKFKPTISSNGQITIKNKASFVNWFGRHSKFKNSDVVIYVPMNQVLDLVHVKCQFGDVVLNNISTKKLKLNAGAGTFELNNITSESTDINCGVGDVDIKEVQFTNTRLKSSIGDIDFHGVLLGLTKIDCGMGDISMTIDKSSDDYNIKANKGLGDITIDGNEYSSVRWNNSTAKNSLDIKGGLGDLDISFLK